ncbi:MAG: replication-associated recombination protein A [Ignavibacteria bacterium]|nr:replication-associated recombination protein A [Ignavibacteria bacterium]
MAGLFDDIETQEREKFFPLAERIRPKNLGDLVGQQHLVGEHGPLGKMIHKGRLRSMILWGPPGTGKTSLARVIANTLDSPFQRISAVETGVKELREIIHKAEISARTGTQHIVFIDEIHRFNKSQQDALLHAVESGTILLIGATTENPSFEVNAALLSRCVVFRLHSLDDADITTLIQHAVQSDPILSSVSIAEIDIPSIVRISGGDARTALNILEGAFLLSESNPDGGLILGKAEIEQAAQQRVVAYDKAGESHYNVSSALIKSMRGSDPDAALLYLAIMIESGEDPTFIARRLIVFASEDVGNANPTALTLAVSTFQAIERIGMPEGRIVLSQCVTYLATSVKSNASYVAIDAALEAVRQGANLTVPMHMRNAPTQLMKNEGYGSGYQYPHSAEQHFVHTSYFPDGTTNVCFYKPDSHEPHILKRLRSWWPERHLDDSADETSV